MHFVFWQKIKLENLSTRQKYLGIKKLKNTVDAKLIILVRARKRNKKIHQTLLKIVLHKFN